jgi:hypothetical protein
MKFSSILLISVNKFECVGELFLIVKKLLKKLRKLTNTFKPIHRNQLNRRKTLHLGVEEFHAPHASSK